MWPLGSAAAGAAAATESLLAQVAEEFVDAFAAHFGYALRQELPDVNQLTAAAAVVLDGGGGSSSPSPGGG